MPAHCYRTFTDQEAGGSELKYAEPYQLDWEVRFNNDMQGINYFPEMGIDDSFKSTSILCNESAASASNLPTDTAYRNFEGSSTTMVGVALDGVRINFPFVDLDDFVTVNNEYMDVCLSYTNDQGQIVYHSMSPCIHSGSKTETPDRCIDNLECSDSF